eukprot:1585893-Prymnesium_polylepis.1
MLILRITTETVTCITERVGVREVRMAREKTCEYAGGPQAAHSASPMEGDATSMLWWTARCVFGSR